MDYSYTLYDAYNRPDKNPRISTRRAIIIGARLSGLAAAAFLIRDGGMPGKNITICEPTGMVGGSVDGLDRNNGFLIRDQKIRDRHFDCFMDLFSTIPSRSNRSVQEDIALYNAKPQRDRAKRIVAEQGKERSDFTKAILSDRSIFALIKLLFYPEEDFDGLSIEEYFDDNFFKSSLWKQFALTFSFTRNYSLLEMRRYLRRYMNILDHINNLDFNLKERFNPYQTYIVPLVRWLKDQGVLIKTDTVVKNIEYDKVANKTYIKKIDVEGPMGPRAIFIGPDDACFFTIGSTFEGEVTGSHFETIEEEEKEEKPFLPSWDLWYKLRDINPNYGNPDNFFIKENKFMTATITLKDNNIAYDINRAVSFRKSGDLYTGVPVYLKDSSWNMTFTIGPQPLSSLQRQDETIVFLKAFTSDRKGSYTPFTMRECNGADITAEWLYHMGVSERLINELAVKHAKTTACITPYDRSCFYKRKIKDRPVTVPKDAANFAFLGHFTEIADECCYLDEYAVRSAMIATYKLFDIKRQIPPVYQPVYDIREDIKALKNALGTRHLSSLSLSPLDNMALKQILKILKKTEIGKLIEKENIL